MEERVAEQVISEPHSGYGGVDSASGRSYSRRAEIDPAGDVMPFYRACEDCGFPPDLSKNLTQIYAAALLDRVIGEGHSPSQS